MKDKFNNDDGQLDDNPGWWSLLGFLFAAAIYLLYKVFTN